MNRNGWILIGIAVAVIAAIAVALGYPKFKHRLPAGPRVLSESLVVGQPGCGLAAMRDSLRAAAGTLKAWQDRTTFRWVREYEYHSYRCIAEDDYKAGHYDKDYDSKRIGIERLTVTVNADSGVRIFTEDNGQAWPGNIPDSVVIRLAAWLSGLVRSERDAASCDTTMRYQLAEWLLRGAAVGEMP